MQPTPQINQQVGKFFSRPLSPEEKLTQKQRKKLKAHFKKFRLKDLTSHGLS